MFNSNNFKEINYLNFDADFSIDLGDIAYESIL